MMLYDDALPPELARCLQSLEVAEAELGVPYPYDEGLDSGVLSRIKARYPEMNVADLVDDFLVWCCENRPWEDEKGKRSKINWRSRLWTRARNQVLYQKKAVKGRKSTHYVASDRSETDEVLDEW